MRPRDLVPLGLIGGIAAFLAVQVAQRPEPRRAAPPAAASSDADADADAATAQPVLAGAARQTTAAAAPAPVRDENAIRVMLRDGAPGTYIMNVLADHRQWIIRWPERQADNLRVWIQRTSTVANWRTDYPLVAERAFGEWRAAGFPLAFQFVHDSAAAQIRIRWTEKFPESDGKRIGVTHLVYDQSGWIVSAEVVLATHDRRAAPLTAGIVGGVARHEVGHALGLGHSTQTSDVMYPESTTPLISARDRATLHLMYKLPPGTMQ